MKNTQLKPQDVVVLLKILCYGNREWLGKDLAADLFISSAEISHSLNRSVFAGLLASDKRTVIRGSLLEFLLHGISYVFPVKKGPESIGIPTAYAVPPLKQLIVSDSPLVWPQFEGKSKGAAISPLFPNVPKAAMADPCLYELLSLVDAIRIGKVREKALAGELLQKKIMS